MANAFPYLLLVIFYGVLAILHKYFLESSEKVKYINILTIFVFIIFFGLRGFVAYDWTVYYSLFYERIPKLGQLFTIPPSKWAVEPGFVLLASTCKTLFTDYIVFQFICTTINICLLVRFFSRYTKNLPACMVLFITMGGIGFSTDLIRNSLSIFIFLNGIEFIEKKRFIPYLLICLCSASFHNSGLAYIPMYIILNRKFNKYILLTIFIIANAICILHIPVFKNLISLFVNIISPKMAQYMDTYMSYDASNTSAFNIGFLERLFTGVMVFCYINKLRELRKSNILVNSMFIYLFINLFLSEFRTISIRCSNLFVFAYWIIWQDLIKCIYYKGNKILYMVFIGCYCLLKAYSGNSGPMSQYYNVLFDYKTHTERTLYFRQHLNDKK